MVIKYPGTIICVKGFFSFSASKELCNFDRSSNAILNVLNDPNQNVLMHLLSTNCVPTLTYACGVKSLSSKDAIRKIFSFNRWESVRDLRTYFGYKSLTEIFAIAGKKFLDSLPHHSNSLIRQIHAYVSPE